MGICHHKVLIMTEAHQQDIPLYDDHMMGMIVVVQEEMTGGMAVLDQDLEGTTITLALTMDDLRHPMALSILRVHHQDEIHATSAILLLTSTHTDGATREIAITRLQTTADHRAIHETETEIVTSDEVVA